MKLEMKKLRKAFWITPCARRVQLALQRSKDWQSFFECQLRSNVDVTGDLWSGGAQRRDATSRPG